ncbi:TPA: hypothetical protein L3N28_003286 [Vibrio parahaemolyticus]|uniref:hypothetical protein n=1 Tax=Vibrio alginolyticus TaxID=663 RepID=UPI00355374F4|nr:hypothetical protein [Vibrio parahaemolyticus]HBN6312892.1 hypothetical protein [Vibrio parahaemolyticus]
MNKSILYSVTSRLLKIFSGPILLIVISNKLSPEEVAIYYAFFNIIAFKQMAELGVGFVVKQSIAYDSSSIEDRMSIILEKANFCFSWFLKVALFVILVVGPLGAIYLTSVSSNVEWQGAWLLLTISSCLSLLVNPILIYLEGVQKITLVYKARLYQSVVYTICLIVFVSFNFDLYSIGLSILISSLVTILIIRGNIDLNHFSFNLRFSIKSGSDEIKNELVPLLVKTGKVWGVGVVFWNALNLISIKVLPLDEAGKLAFSLAIGKSIYTVCEAFLAPQLSKYSNLIGNDKVDKAIKQFQIYRWISVTGLFIMFLFLFLLSEPLNNYLFNGKLLVGENFFLILCFYFFLFLMTSQNNFVRCFKVEPFVWLSAMNAVFVPVSFFLLVRLQISYYMIGPVLSMVLGCFISACIYRRYMSKFSVNKGDL